MTPTLEIYLIIFLSVTAVILIIISVFTIKLILELSKLTNNLNDITTVVKSELEPTIGELRLTLNSINSIVKAADRKVSDFKGIAAKVLGAGSLALGSIKGLTGSFWKGVSAGMKMFGRKK